MLKTISFDKAIIFLGLLYMFLPILTFFNTFLNFFGILFSIVFIYFFYKLFKHLCIKEMPLLNKKNILYWIIAIVVILAWVYLSGIGGFSYQNDDFWARNAIYEVYSFGNTHYYGDDKEDSIKMISDQFFAYNYQDSFFFRYLAKRG